MVSCQLPVTLLSLFVGTPVCHVARVVMCCGRWRWRSFFPRTSHKKGFVDAQIETIGEAMTASLVWWLHWQCSWTYDKAIVAMQGDDGLCFALVGAPPCLGVCDDGVVGCLVFRAAVSRAPIRKYA